MVRIGEMGKRYGYCYQPKRFTDPDAGVSGTSEWFPGGGPGVPFRRLPWFDTREEAVQFLKDNNWYGQVIRYAKNENGERSWVTAGVTDIVNAPPEFMHCSPGGNHKNIKVHHADGTINEEAGAYLAKLSLSIAEMEDPGEMSEHE